jgi:hypothetical protein
MNNENKETRKYSIKEKAFVYGVIAVPAVIAYKVGYRKSMHNCARVLTLADMVNPNVGIELTKALKVIKGIKR